MNIVLSLLIGYLLGTISPAALVARWKHKNLRESGSGNLGATNTMVVFGKRYGALVLIFDLAKAFFAMKIAEWLLVPELPAVWLAAGVCAVLGHCFPFYMQFRGGKGLATFGGIVLAYNPWLFLFLLVTGIALLILLNHGFVLSYYAAILFAVYVVICEKSLTAELLAAFVSLLILAEHFENVVAAKNGTDTNIRGYLKTKFFHSSSDKQ